MSTHTNSIGPSLTHNLGDLHVPTMMLLTWHVPLLAFVYRNMPRILSFLSSFQHQLSSASTELASDMETIIQGNILGW